MIIVPLMRLKPISFEWRWIKKKNALCIYTVPMPTSNNKKRITYQININSISKRMCNIAPIGKGLFFLLSSIRSIYNHTVFRKVRALALCVAFCRWLYGLLDVLYGTQHIKVCYGSGYALLLFIFCSVFSSSKDWKN